MTFKVILVYNGEEISVTSSKTELVEDFQKKVFEMTKVEPSLQQLLFGGKFLNAKNQAKLNNYRIEDGFKVQLFARNPLQGVSMNNNGYNENSSGRELAPPEEAAPQVCNPWNPCKKKPGRVCRECNCRECGVPERDEVALFCEECQYVTHIYCVDPPINESKGKDSDWRAEMDELPDEWYCPHCKITPNHSFLE